MNVMTARRSPRKEKEKMTTLKPERQGATTQKVAGKPATKEARPAQRRPAAASLKADPSRKAGSTKSATSSPKHVGTTRQGSKTAKILELLKRPAGATLKEIMKATGWQPHSVRGFLSGTLRKKLGIHVNSFKDDDKERSYRVSSK
jgi:hypothetical protein